LRCRRRPGLGLVADHRLQRAHGKHRALAAADRERDWAQRHGAPPWLPRRPPYSKRSRRVRVRCRTEFLVLGGFTSRTGGKPLLHPAPDCDPVLNFPGALADNFVIPPGTRIVSTGVVPRWVQWPETGVR